MSLNYVLNLLGNKMGLNPNDPSQRPILLRFANQGAKELYRKADIAGSLGEQSFQIQANQTIAMPDYVGQIRAMREQFSHIALNLSQMRPRYNQYNWESEWRDWRLKGLHPLQTSLTNQSQLVFSIAVVENPPITINISGPTNNAAVASETIVMSSTSVNSVNEYNDVSAITKTAVSENNVTVSDVDGNQISYIANNKLKALFQIVDISTSPWWPVGVNPLCGWVEVLFKTALPHYENDNDEFPVPGYDTIWVDKCLQIWAEEQGNVNEALAYMTKVTNSLAEMQEDANRGTDDCASIVEPTIDRINPRVGYGRDYWYAYRISGR